MRVVFLPLDGSRQVGPMNALFTGIANASDGVDGYNLAEEGLVRGSFEGDAASRNRFRLNIATRNAVKLANTSPFAPFEHNGQLVRSTNLGALAATSALRIRTCVWFGSQVGSPGFPKAATMIMRHTINNGGGTAKIPFSEHGHAKFRNDYNQHAAMVRESWLFGPLDEVAYVELQYSYPATAGADAFPTRTTMSVAEFLRVDVR